MKIKKKLKVTPEEFFEVLEESLHHDIEAYGKKTKGTYMLEKGFKYTKKLKQGKKIFHVTITILEYEKPLLYQTKIATDNSTYFIKYEIQSINSGIEVFYTEEMQDSQGNTNTPFMINFFGKIKSIKIKRMLSGMERYSLN